LAILGQPQPEYRSQAIGRLEVDVALTGDEAAEDRAVDTGLRGQDGERDLMLLGPPADSLAKLVREASRGITLGHCR
jgi:hypothetical protein